MRSSDRVCALPRLEQSTQPKALASSGLETGGLATPALAIGLLRRSALHKAASVRGIEWHQGSSGSWWKPCHNTG